MIVTLQYDWCGHAACEAVDVPDSKGEKLIASRMAVKGKVAKKAAKKAPKPKK